VNATFEAATLKTLDISMCSGSVILQRGAYTVT
jgi:hypothetical protein